MRRAVDILLGTRLIACLLQRTIDKAVLGIHDGRLRVAGRLLQHTGSSMVAHGQQLLAVFGTVLVGQVLSHVLRDVGVVL